MGLSLKVLGSSSSGNCGLLAYNGNYFLIDAGFSGKKIRELLQTYGLVLEDLSGVFVTHEHHDHIVGLKVLARKNIPFFANKRTAEAIEKKYALNYHWRIFESGREFLMQGLKIRPLIISHDAIEPVSFVFKSEEETCVWVTDIGSLEGNIVAAISEADILVLESNHDEQMVREHPTRPEYLKERILGPLGHLSNRTAYQLLKNTEGHWRTVCLAHLSKDCNSVQKVKQLFQPLADERQFELVIVDPELA